jgi:hypothetical protein
MHCCLTLLKNKRKLVLSFMNVNPQSSDSALLDQRRSQNIEWNAMHNFKDE